MEYSFLPHIETHIPTAEEMDRSQAILESEIQKANEMEAQRKLFTSSVMPYLYIGGGVLAIYLIARAIR